MKTKQHGVDQTQTCGDPPSPPSLSFLYLLPFFPTSPLVYFLSLPPLVPPSRPCSHPDSWLM